VNPESVLARTVCRCRAGSGGDWGGPSRWGHCSRSTGTRVDPVPARRASSGRRAVVLRLV